MYPDPADASLLNARAWFQANHPNDVTVVSVYRNIKVNETTWTTTLKGNGSFPAPVAANINSARKLFQRAYSQKCKVLNLTIRADERDMILWMVETKPLTSSCYTGITRIFRRRTAYDETRPSPEYDRSTSLLSSSISDPTRDNAVNTTCVSIPSADVSVLIKRGDNKIVVPPANVTPEDAPLRLIQYGRNVTRKYTQKSSLCRKVFSIVKDHLTEEPENVRKFFAKTSVKFHKATSSDQSSQTVICGSEWVQASQPTEERKRTEIPYNYDVALTRNMYLKSKLANHITFRNVRRYIITKFGIPGYGTVPLKDSPIEIANMLQVEGLPLDESIRTLYSEYCKERNIAIDAELELYNYARDVKNRPIHVR